MGDNGAAKKISELTGVPIEHCAEQIAMAISATARANHSCLREWFIILPLAESVSFLHPCGAGRRLPLKAHTVLMAEIVVKNQGWLDNANDYS